MAATKAVKFSKLLAAALKRSNITQDQAASVLRIPAATFRTWLARNSFNRRDATRLMAAVGIPMPASTAIDYGGRWDDQGEVGQEGQTLAQVIGTLDRQRRVLDRQMDRFAGRLATLVRSMRRYDRPAKGFDLSICTSSTVTPLEFEPDADEGVVEAMGAAVNNEAVFVHIRPNRTYLDRFVGNWPFTRVPGFDDIQLEVKWFRERLQANLVKAHGVSAERAAQLVQDHVLQFYVADSPFWAAGISIGMFHTQEIDGSTVRRMTVRLPGTHCRAMIQPADYDMFAARFTMFAIHSLRQVIGKASGKPALRQPTPPNRPLVQEVIDTLEKGGVYG